jgi:hypothetical protein
MCIQTADVNSVICLIFEKINEIVENENYGINCDQSVLVTDVKAIYDYYKFKCYSTDFIRNQILNSTLPAQCNRITFINSIPR